MTKINTIIAATGQISSGIIVTMETSGAFVSADALKAALVAQGIKHALPKTRQSTYLRRIIKELMDEGLVRKIGEDHEKVSFAVVHEDTELGAASWRGEMSESITLIKASGAVLCTKGSALGLRVVEAMQSHVGGYVGSEITRIFSHVLRVHALAFNLRSRGGVLFVPDTHREVIDKLKQVTQATTMGNHVLINTFDTMLNVSTLADVQRALGMRIEEEIKGLLRIVTAQRESGRLNRPSSFADKERQCKQLIKRTLQLSQMLSFDMKSQKLALKALLGEIRIGYQDAVREHALARQNGRFAKSKTKTQRVAAQKTNKPRRLRVVGGV